MPIEDYGPDEIGAKGESIYREKIQALVGPAEAEKFVVIDIESGDYEVDEEALAASLRLRERHPEAVNYGIRVGHPAAYSLGGELGPAGVTTWP